jgi:hypothetical protein
MSAFVSAFAWAVGTAVCFALGCCILCWLHYVHRPARQAYERRLAKLQQTAPVVTIAPPVDRPAPPLPDVDETIITTIEKG